MLLLDPSLKTRGLMLGSGTRTHAGTMGKYFFATERKRTPTNSPATVTANTVYTLHKSVFYSPPYWTNNYRGGYPDHYTLTNNGVPSEFVLSGGPYTILGVVLMALIDGKTWVPVSATFGGAASKVVVPAYASGGASTDDIIFPTDLPPTTPLQEVVYLYAPVGTQIPGGIMSNYTGPGDGTLANLEQARGSATDTLGGLLTYPGSISSFGGTGNLSGVFGASVWVCKSTRADLDRPVFWLFADSIEWGDTEAGVANVLANPRYHGGYGAITRALTDESRSRRMVVYNMACPGTGAGEVQNRAASAGKLALLHKVSPNRPWTHMICGHYNNGPAGDYQSQFVPAFLNLWAMLTAESLSWGDPAAAPLYQKLPIPSPGSSDFGTTVSGQGLSTGNMQAYTNTRWNFYNDLKAGRFPQLAGTIDTGRDMTVDRLLNIDLVKPDPFATTLTAPCLATDQVLNLADAVNWSDKLVLSPGAVNVNQVATAVIKSGGSGGTNGTATVTGTTGTGDRFTANVTISGGAMTAVNAITPGAYVANPTSLSAEPVTGGGLVGATMTLTMLLVQGMQARHVEAFGGSAAVVGSSGKNPRLDSPIGIAYPAGTIVKRTGFGDGPGTHQAPSSNIGQSAPVIDWKNAMFGS